MEVAPTAHYTMGGLVVEPEQHATRVTGLYAAGEVTAGLHGANRLGGNSLAETVVFGRRAGQAAADYALSLQAQRRSNAVIRAANDELDQLIKPGSEIARPLQRALRDTMWQHCGVVRAEDRLQEGLRKIEAIKRSAQNLDVRPSAEGYQDLALALDLRAALASAEATVRGAIERRGSRGAHQRSDYRDFDPALAVNFVVQLDADGQQRISAKPVPPVPSELTSWLQDHQLEVEGRLLE